MALSSKLAKGEPELMTFVWFFFDLPPDLMESMPLIKLILFPPRIPTPPLLLFYPVAAIFLLLDIFFYFTYYLFWLGNIFMPSLFV